MKVYSQATLNEILDLHAKWIRNENGGRRADLSWSDLTGVDLSNADLLGANLSNTNLSRADMYWTNLRSADLTGATLTGANLSHANFHSADLPNANFTYADLSHANFHRASMQGVNLTQADLTGACMVDANMHDATLVDLCSMCGVIGNMAEIKSIQCSIWPVTYTKTQMQIGCQLHELDKWWEFTDDQISRMDSKALSWWQKWKPVLKTIIEMDPAI